MEPASTSLYEMEKASPTADPSAALPDELVEKSVEESSNIDEKIETKEDEYPTGFRLVLVTVCLSFALE